MYSCDEGVGWYWGDGPAIFKLMLERMGVAAPDALFIDNSKNKIKIADGIGLQTMLFGNRNQFLEISNNFYEKYTNYRRWVNWQAPYVICFLLVKNRIFIVEPNADMAEKEIEKNMRSKRTA